MAILYDDQFRAIAGLGADEKLVIACLASGDTDEDIVKILAKRRARDTTLTVVQLREGLYKKIRHEVEEPTPGELRRAIGRLYRDYVEMVQSQVPTRPLVGAYVPPPSKDILDIMAEKENGRARIPPSDEIPQEGKRAARPMGLPRVRAKRGKQEVAISLTQEQLEEIALGVPILSASKRKLLKAMSDHPDASGVQKACGLADNSIKAYTYQLYDELGISDLGLGAAEKRAIMVAVYRISENVVQPKAKKVG